MQGGPGLIPDWGAEIPHISRPKTKTQNRNNVVTNPIKTLKMVHIRKIKTCGLKSLIFFMLHLISLFWLKSRQVTFWEKIKPGQWCYKCSFWYSRLNALSDFEETLGIPKLPCSHLGTGWIYLPQFPPSTKSPWCPQSGRQLSNLHLFFFLLVMAG